MIIGITGKKHNGKDTVGDYYEKLGFVKLSFAQPLKQVCKCIFDFDNDQLYGDKKEQIDEYWKVKPRTIFQYVGTVIITSCLHEVSY